MRDFMSAEAYMYSLFSFFFIVISFVISFIIWNRIKKAGKELNNSNLEDAGGLAILYLQAVGILVIVFISILILFNF